MLMLIYEITSVIACSGPRHIALMILTLLLNLMVLFLFEVPEE